MNNSAIGLVETYGYIGAIEASDVCLKSANVELVGCEFVTGGIVTIQITGDVAAVKAAIEAAEIAVKKVGTLRTTHVIARTSEDVWKMLKKEKEDNKEKEIENEESNQETYNRVVEVVEETSIDDSCEMTENIEKLPENIIVVKNDEVNEEEVTSVIDRRDELENMKVSELRTLARNIKLTSLTKKQIKFAKKDELVKAIIKFYERS